MEKVVGKNDQVINYVDFEIVNSTTLGMVNAHIAGTIKDSTKEFDLS